MAANQLLTIDQLGRYLGKSIQYEYRTIAGDWETAIRPMTMNTLSVSKHYIRNIRPVLRRFSAMDKEELFKAFVIVFGFGCWQNEPYGENVEEDKIEVYAYKKGIRYDISFFSNSKIAVTGWEPAIGYFSPIYDASALIDYLDHISVDQRGLIDQGLAVEQKVQE